VRFWVGQFYVRELDRIRDQQVRAAMADKVLPSKQHEKTKRYRDTLQSEKRAGRPLSLVSMQARQKIIDQGRKIFGNRKRLYQVAVKRPWGKSKQILDSTKAAALKEFGLRLTDRQIRDCAQQYRAFERDEN
jgi:hypothetical protein